MPTIANISNSRHQHLLYFGGNHELLEIDFVENQMMQRK